MLNDYDIPLYLSHTITDIRGKERVEAVTVSRVGSDMAPIPGTEMTFDCDTVLLSVGLVPENELTRAADIDIDPRTNGPRVFENMETSMPGVFACGNVVHVHDLVDFVTEESEHAGAAAGRYAAGISNEPGRTLTLINGGGVGYTVPQTLRRGNVEKSAGVFLRVKGVYSDAALVVTDEAGNTVARFRREHMAPGEMQRITLPKALLDKAQGDTLTVSVERSDS